MKGLFLLENQTDSHGAAIQAMFGRIARRYDMMNRLITFGQDRRYRRFLVRQAHLAPGDRLLDIATGTGDIAFEALRQVDDLRVVAADFALPMMRIAQTRERAANFAQPVRWQAADTLHLPYPDQTFDAVTSGFLFRNVADMPGALREQCRVLKPGGWLVTLDTTPPSRNLLRPFIWLYLKLVIPTMGRIITGDAAAYAYLPASTLQFKTAEELANLMRTAGLGKVQYKRFMFGTMAVHWGQKDER